MFGIQVTTFVGGAIASVGLLLSSLLTDKVIEIKKMWLIFPCGDFWTHKREIYIPLCVSSGGTALFNVWRYVRSWCKSRLHSESGNIGSLLQEVPRLSERHRHGRKFRIHGAHSVSYGISITAYRSGRDTEKPGRTHGYYHGLCDSFQANIT